MMRIAGAVFLMALYVLPCFHAGDNLVTNSLTMKDGRRANIIWNPRESRKHEFPKAWKVREVWTVYNERIDSREAIVAGDAPMLVVLE